MYVKRRSRKRNKSNPFCCRTSISLYDLKVHASVLSSVRLMFTRPRTLFISAIRAHLLLHFYANVSETLLAFSPWCGDVHVLRKQLLDLYCYVLVGFFPLCLLNPPAGLSLFLYSFCFKRPFPPRRLLITKVKNISD